MQSKQTETTEINICFLIPFSDRRLQ